MGDDAALRLLDLVKHKLAADDARIEIGGDPPETATSVWVAFGSNRRVVAVFAEQPPTDAGAKLAALVDAFAASADAPASDGPVALARRTHPSEIDAELNGLAMRSKALCAVLIDASSPIVWGRSHPDLDPEIATMFDIADDLGDRDPADLIQSPAEWPPILRERAGASGKDADVARRVVAAALGVQEARKAVEKEPTLIGSVHRIVRRGSYAFMMRSLAGVYLVILAFEGGFSEPQAEGVIKRGSTQLENLIVKLPPTDPPPKPGRVLSLRRPTGVD